MSTWKMHESRQRKCHAGGPIRRDFRSEADFKAAFNFQETVLPSAILALHSHPCRPYFISVSGCEHVSAGVQDSSIRASDPQDTHWEAIREHYGTADRNLERRGIEMDGSWSDCVLL